MLFSSLPVFLSVAIPLAVLVFFGILFEDRLVKIEQRFFCHVKKQFSSKKRKNSARSKKTAAIRPAMQKREQFRRVA